MLAFFKRLDDAPINLLVEAKMVEPLLHRGLIPHGLALEAERLWDLNAMSLEEAGALLGEISIILTGDPHALEETMDELCEGVGVAEAALVIACQKWDGAVARWLAAAQNYAKEDES